MGVSFVLLQSFKAMMTVCPEKRPSRHLDPFGSDASVRVKKKIAKIGGLFKGHKIDYAGIEGELKKLSKHSRKDILDEAGK